MSTTITYRGETIHLDENQLQYRLVINFDKKGKMTLRQETDEEHTKRFGFKEIIPQRGRPKKK